MFQKLYRHLEEINTTLRRQEAAVGTSGIYEKEILQQLHVLNETIELAKKERQTVKSPSPVMPVAFLVMAFIAIGAIVVLNFQISDLTRNLANAQEKAIRQIQMEQANTGDRQNQLRQQKQGAAQLTRLDSIVSQQNQAILELKDLNKISVHTYIRLKSRIDQSDHFIRLLKSDSGQSIGRAK
jgi:hypothetical protein